MDVFELLGNTPDGILAVDRQQRIAFWNDGARRILGFEARSVLGRHCYEVLGGRDGSGCAVCKKLCASISAAIGGDLAPTRDVETHTGAGERKWINVTTFVLPSRYRELSLLAHVFRDASEAHLQESQLHQILNGLESDPVPHSLPHPRDLLTAREADVLRLLASGMSTKSISARLGVEGTTVRTHVQHILEKLGVHSRLEAVAHASHNGLLRASGK